LAQLRQITPTAKNRSLTPPPRQLPDVERVIAPTAAKWSNSTPGASSLQTSNLQIGSHPLDPRIPVLKSQILSKLGLEPSARIDTLQQSGGLNDGCWVVRSASQEIILKLVKYNRREGEKLSNLLYQHPSIAHDPNLCFPSHVMHCIGTDGKRRYDLVVMEKVRGLPLSDFIGAKWYANQGAQVMRVIEKLGSLLRDFHMQYAHSQHGDFQPSNIFYEEAADQIKFIDVAGISASVYAQNQDKEHFLQSLQLISKAYGSNFFADASRAFETGYNRGEAPTTLQRFCSTPVQRFG
jgi:hypothetical protein